MPRSCSVTSPSLRRERLPFSKYTSPLFSKDWIWTCLRCPYTHLQVSCLLNLQFVELCILLGCDYLEPIKGVGPKSALKLLKEHGSLEEVIEHLRAKQVKRQQEAEEEEEEDAHAGSDGELEESPKKRKKRVGGVQIPEDWPWEKAKTLFLEPDVTPAEDLDVRVSLIDEINTHSLIARMESP